MPRPVVLDGEDEELILKEDEDDGEGRRVPVRVFRPSKDDGKGEVRGVFCHIHGGGWVLQSEKYQVG